MHWPAVTVGLQDQYAWPFREVGVIFEQFCIGQSGYNVTNEDTVSREFIVPVVGYFDLAPTREGHDLFQRLTHGGMLARSRELGNDALIILRRTTAFTR